MKKSKITHFAVSMAFVCCVLFTFISDSASQNQTDTPVTESKTTIEAPFDTPLKWTSSDILVKPVSDETHSIVSV